MVLEGLEQSCACYNTYSYTYIYVSILIPHIQPEGVATSPNSPLSASYGSNRPLPASSHTTSSPSPSPTLSANTPTLSSQANLSPISLPPTHIHTKLSPTHPPPPFLLPFASQTTTSIGSSSGQRSYEHREHEPGETEDTGRYVCGWDECNMEFPNLSYLVAHLDRGHTATMVTYRCLWKDCQRERKPFDARYKLITHLRCHTGEKPYKCDVKDCNRSFSRLENLKLHVRTHTGEKPYACHYENCSKRFNNTSDRAKHMKTHITRKPYACKIPGCTKSYTDPSSMRKHVKFAHRIREGSSESSSNSSTGSRSPRKASSPSGISHSPHLASDQTSPVLHYPIPPLTKLPITTHTPSNRMSVIRHDTPSCLASRFLSPRTASTTVAPQLLQTPTASGPPLFPLPVIQIPSIGLHNSVTAHPAGLLPVMMQVQGTDQKVIVFVPSASVPHGPVTSFQDSLLQSHSVNTSRPSVLVSPSQSPSQITPTSTIHVPPASGSTAALQTSPQAVEYQVRMQVAHLQQQLLTKYEKEASSSATQLPILTSSSTQLPRALEVTRLTVPSPLKAEMAVPNIKDEAIPIGILPTPQEPASTPVVLQTATGQNLLLNTIQPPQIIHTSHGAQYVQPATGFVQLSQLPNLTSVNLAQTIAQPSSSQNLSNPQSKPSVSIKPLTVVTNPTQHLGFSGQTMVLPSGQVFSVVPSTTHVLMPPQTLPSDNRC